ncbi:MAG: 5-methyltetrahydropteroyltriglutamate--homocysteine S-methyltransferase [bacterium]|nr:5-methyltetrahydropteroyltriglutamate--homocysteine S-methyltransferase [bacterium]
MKSYAYGFPRLGAEREFKKAVEGFWAGELDETGLRGELEKLERDIIARYRAHVDWYAVGEVTPYDSMLDTAIMVGVYAPRDLREYYELCRGGQALEMTKWFNTNYHYLVPDFGVVGGVQFRLQRNFVKEAAEKYPEGVPRVIGPFTFLKLSKGIGTGEFGERLEELAWVYAEALRGVKEVHLDEPGFVLELREEEIEAIKRAYGVLAGAGCRLHVFAYYDSVDWMGDLYELPVASLGLDFVHGREGLGYLERHGYPSDKVLVAGVVDGRNVWRSDVVHLARVLRALGIPEERLIVSNACPLMHVPVTVRGQELPSALVPQLAFAEEKLYELKLITEVYGGKSVGTWKQVSTFGRNAAVRERVARLGAEDFERRPSYEERRRVQSEELRLPLFPTTTIGSFPQTADVRAARWQHAKGAMDDEAYEGFVREKIREVIAFQEEVGLDVLVHGEFERSDMVEFFAQQMEGVATTKNGWILSYGTRTYRPAIIFGDVRRRGPMTVKETQYAQSLTRKPVKGMLTGAVTIIAWNYVREDVPVEEVAWQIALALRDEIADLEAAGIKVIQIDEPAFKERAPVKKRGYAGYFEWAVKSFRLATAGAKAGTQIHTHMCYSEFGDIVREIEAMDFDVISIEASRSRGDIIEAFEREGFRRQIGLGVWDIHSPVVPTREGMKGIVERALQVIGKENIWINPDCGLKTRGWAETKEALRGMVAVARELREAAG